MAIAWAIAGCDIAADGRDGAAPGLGDEDLSEADPEAEWTKDEVAAAAAAGQAAWSEDICEISVNAYGQTWYEDGECDWFCALPDPACDVPALGPTPSGAHTRYPIVLVHGFMSGATQLEGVRAALSADGHAVLAAELPAIAPVSERAEALAVWVDHARYTFGTERVNLVAHSMGGLDARYLVSSLGYDDRVASVTTVATPHRGSRIADLALGLSQSESSTMQAVRDLILARIEANFDDYDKEALDAALWDLTEGAAPWFAEDNPDRAGVHYQSWAGVSSKIAKWPADTEAACGDVLAHEASWFGFGADLMSPKLAPLSMFLHPHSDGVVALPSAVWGDFRGCIPADHLEQTATDGPLWITGYDATRFFRNLAFDLAKRGY